MLIFCAMYSWVSLQVYMTSREVRVQSWIAPAQFWSQLLSFNFKHLWTLEIWSTKWVRTQNTCRVQIDRVVKPSAKLERHKPGHWHCSCVAPPVLAVRVRHMVQPARPWMVFHRRGVEPLLVSLGSGARLPRGLSPRYVQPSDQAHANIEPFTFYRAMQPYLPWSARRRRPRLWCCWLTHLFSPCLVYFQ